MKRMRRGTRGREGEEISGELNQGEAVHSPGGIVFLH